MEDSFAINTRRQGAMAMTEYVGAVEKQTLENTYFRQVPFTAEHTQLVVMCLQPGEDIGDEVHSAVDQFFRIERGEGKFVFNEKVERRVHDGDAVIVPAGTYHNVINTSETAMLKLYTLYSPPNHPDGTVHKTKAEAEAAELAEHSKVL
jgi:mannose-6-phosphate isomerase-like protein (cupin superfamily)